MWVSFGAYLGALAIAPRLGRRPLWLAILVLLACFALLPPLLSNDVYSYVDYARLGVLHGLDPYVHPPLAAPSDPAFAEVDWVDATSAYGPLFTLATYPLAWLPVDGAVLALKLVAALSVVVLAATLARVAPGRGLDPTRAAAFVALNPLVLVHVVGGAHNDGLAMALGMLAVAAVLAAREATGGALLVAGVAVKASAAFLAPFALLGANRRRKLLAGAAAMLLAIALGAQHAFGWDWLSAFGLAGESQRRTSHMSLPATTARLTGLDPEAVRVGALVLYAALFAWLLAWTWRGGDWIRAAGWAALGLLLASSWLLPWYLVWVLPLAAISRDRPLQLLTLALSAYQLGARIPL